jgi:hypothetical protein
MRLNATVCNDLQRILGVVAARSGFSCPGASRSGVRESGASQTVARSVTPARSTTHFDLVRDRSDGATSYSSPVVLRLVDNALL